jgi:hypothetical protein
MIEEEILGAYVDGQIDPVTEQRVEAALTQNASAKAFVAEQRALSLHLASRFDAVLAEPVPDRLAAMLRGKVTPLPERRRAAPRRWWPQVVAVAASFAIGMWTAGLLPAGGDRPVEMPALASGDLAQALESQLASAQDPDAATRIGVSFAAVDGRLCRSFDTSDVTGLACREPQGWSIVASARSPASSAADYRQAGSGSIFVMQYAQELMAGEPFDAEQERAAAEADWQPRR